MEAIKIEDGEIVTAPGLYSNVPIERYHSGTLCDGPSISSSGLRTIFSESEMAYWINSPHNPQRLPQETKQHFSIGKAVHHLVAGEAEFTKHFSVLPDRFPDFKTAAAREWRDLQVSSGLTVLTAKDIDDIRGIAGVLPWQKGIDDCGLKNNALVRDHGVLSGLIEHTFAYRERGVWLLSRPDAVPNSSGDFADLKTTSSVADDDLSRAIGEYRYDMQAALCRMLARSVLGIDVGHFSLVFVMKKPPYAVRVVEIHHEDMDAAEADVRLAILAFERGMNTGKWPGPGGTQEDGRTIRVNGWSRTIANSRHQNLALELEMAGRSAARHQQEHAH